MDLSQYNMLYEVFELKCNIILRQIELFLIFILRHILSGTCSRDKLDLCRLQEAYLL